jgi:hypothetical protein
MDVILKRGLVFGVIGSLLCLPLLEFGNLGANKLESKALSTIVAAQSEKLKEYGIDYFEINVCVRGINRCYNEFESQLGETVVSYSPFRDLYLDGVEAELIGKKWTVLVDEKVKGLDLEETKMNFTSLLSVYIDKLDSQIEKEKEWQSAYLTTQSE